MEGRQEVEKREDGMNVLILQSVTLREFIVDQQCRFISISLQVKEIMSSGITNDDITLLSSVDIGKSVNELNPYLVNQKVNR